MIWVRWAIPDMSSELRDKIRREAYITNEIIIKQEAERARKLTCGKNNEFFTDIPSLNTAHRHSFRSTGRYKARRSGTGYRYEKGGRIDVKQFTWVAIGSIHAWRGRPICTRTC